MQTNIREYSSGMTVEIDTDKQSGRLAILSNAGCCLGGGITSTDLLDVIDWIRANRPDLLDRPPKKTLEDYYTRYEPRPGDTVEMFERYEAFCEKDPRPTDHTYFAWYARLSKWMEEMKDPQTQCAH